MAYDEAARRKLLETTTLAGIIGSAALLVIGAAVVMFEQHMRTGGLMLMFFALFLMGVAQVTGYQFDTLRFIGQKTRGSREFEHLSRWTQIKTSSVLHNLLSVLGALILVTAVIGRVGLIELTLTGPQADRALSIFLVIFGLNAAYVHYLSMRVELEPDRTAGSRLLFWIGLQFALLVGAFAAYVDFFSVELTLGGVALQPQDAAVVMVAAFAFMGVMLQVSRGLPSLFTVLADPKLQRRGGYISQTKAVVMPTMVAFTLLFVVLLLIVIFGAGLFSVLDQVGRSSSVIAVLALMISGVLVGLGIAIYLARQEDRVELFHEMRSKEEQVAMGIGLGSLVLGLIVIFIAVRVNQGGWGPFQQSSYIHVAAIGLLITMGPYGFYAARRHKRIQRMETRFPDFLRDLASSHKGGLTLVQSVQVTARGEYGELTPEIRRLADQLTWHVSFDEAFRRFSERVRTPLVQRSVNLVLEAGHSGGSTTDVLLAAARDAREIKTLEKERNLNMSVYTTVIYVTFFVFLFVIGVMVGQFLPEILAASEATQDSELQGGSVVSLGGVTEGDYRQFYFIAAVVQAIGNGMLAGIMGSGHTVLGLRHAFIMIFVTYIAFGFVL